VTRVVGVVEHPTGTAETYTSLSAVPRPFQEIRTTTSVGGEFSRRGALVSLPANVALFQTRGDGSLLLVEIKNTQSSSESWEPDPITLFSGLAGARISRTRLDGPHYRREFVSSGTSLSAPASYETEPLVDVEIDVTLTSPPLHFVPLRAEMKFVGRDEPRIFVDPDSD